MADSEMASMERTPLGSLPSGNEPRARTGLWVALERLDQLLERAVVAAQITYGPEAVADPFRGLHISQDEVDRLLAREPGRPTPTVDDHPEFLADAVELESRVGWLQQTFGLSPFETAIVLIALAPEIDLRYERLYAYLQNDVTKKRPSVDLALNLLCATKEEKLCQRGHFSADAPLIEQNILHLIPDPQQAQPPLLAHYLKLDEQIVNLVLEQDGLDARLVPCCQVINSAVSWDEVPLAPTDRQGLAMLARQARENNESLKLHFSGPSNIAKRQAAEALAFEVGAPLLRVDLARVLDRSAETAALLKLIFREAWLKDAVLYVDGLDALFIDDRKLQCNELIEELANDAGITVLAGKRPWPPAELPPMNRTIGIIDIPFGMPDFARRQECWQRHLAMGGTTVDSHELDALAGRFRLTSGQIAEAASTACNHARWRAAAAQTAESSSPPETQPILDDLFTAARAQAGFALERLAHKIDPKYTWDDIVLPDDTQAQLREICQRVAYQHRVMGEWGFECKLSMGKGVNALFAGPSGTGKTMAAEIVANELRLELYKIDLSGVVSKYIGETEKNLDRIFTAAENANAILFFDEADALFGKRSEVRDSHDRYANIEISYMLQKMEEYEGIAILATNLRQNLDESFVRRLAFTVHFPFPNETDRRGIWAGIWPAETPLANDVDLDFLARQFKLSGGNIKNIALASAFRAAAGGGVVTMSHLLGAINREYQKLGKQLSAAELEPRGQEVLA